MQVLCQSKENHRSRSVQCLTIRQFDFQIDIFVLTFVHYLRLKGQVRDANMPIAWLSSLDLRHGSEGGV